MNEFVPAWPTETVCTIHKWGCCSKAGVYTIVTFLLAWGPQFPINVTTCSLVLMRTWDPPHLRHFFTIQSRTIWFPLHSKHCIAPTAFTYTGAGGNHCWNWIIVSRNTVKSKILISQTSFNLQHNQERLVWSPSICRAIGVLSNLSNSFPKTPMSIDSSQFFEPVVRPLYITASFPIWLVMKFMWESPLQWMIHSFRDLVEKSSTVRDSLTLTTSLTWLFTISSQGMGVNLSSKS